MISVNIRLRGVKDEPCRSQKMIATSPKLRDTWCYVSTPNLLEDNIWTAIEDAVCDVVNQEVIHTIPNPLVPCFGLLSYLMRIAKGYSEKVSLLVLHVYRLYEDQRGLQYNWSWHVAKSGAGLSKETSEDCPLSAWAPKLFKMNDQQKVMEDVKKLLKGRLSSFQTLQALYVGPTMLG